MRGVVDGEDVDACVSERRVGLSGKDDNGEGVFLMVVYECGEHHLAYAYGGSCDGYFGYFSSDEDFIDRCCRMFQPPLVVRIVVLERECELSLRGNNLFMRLRYPSRFSRQIACRDKDISAYALMSV